MDKQKVYFPNLNGLRFIAASLVIIHHIEQIKSIYNLGNYWETSPFVEIIGKLGVVLFFVLSGFLITYLLLSEELAFKSISIRKFYIRRILRIWPLYFLIITLAFTVLPNLGIFTLPGLGKEITYSNLLLKLLFYLMFLPNLVLTVLGVVPYASHTWSIGTEEQFYLVWPVLLKYFKKYRMWLMAFIILFYLTFARILVSDYAYIIPYHVSVRSFLSIFNIDCMAIGGIYAILLFQKSNVLKFILNNLLFYSTVALLLFLMVNGVYIPYIHFEVYSVLFGIIIINLAANDSLKFSLENRPLTYLGSISYGIYMYHPIAIVLAVSFTVSIGFITNWLLYPLTFILTIIIAGVSYKHYESIFLKFKGKFTKVSSGNQSFEEL